MRKMLGWPLLSWRALLSHCCLLLWICSWLSSGGSQESEHWLSHPPLWSPPLLAAQRWSLMPQGCCWDCWLLEGLSGHCSAASVEIPYSKRSTSRWCVGCHRTRSQWYTAEAPGFGSSPEPSFLLQGAKHQRSLPSAALLSEPCVLRAARGSSPTAEPLPARRPQLLRAARVLAGRRWAETPPEQTGGRRARPGRAGPGRGRPPGGSGGRRRPVRSVPSRS